MGNSATEGDPLVLPLGKPGWSLTVGGGAWASITHPDPTYLAWIRVQGQLDGRLRVVSLVVDSVIPADGDAWPGEGRVAGITGRLLDELPLGVIETAINMPGVGDRIRWRENTDMAPVLAAVRVAQGTPSPGRPGARTRVRMPKLKLEVPPGAKPDRFYARVAGVYASAGIYSRSPARDVAEANDVPVTTVNRWVKEARRRGLLAPSARTKGEGR